MDGAPSGKMGKFSPTGKKKKERWLLTRKTWRYMADAGRRLIPEGHPIRGPEDLPKIEAYFQEVCSKESKFLLWRKQSYPGAMVMRRGRRRKKGGSYREKTWSADEAEEIKKDLEQPSTSSSSSRLDLPRMKEEFLFGKPKEDEELISTLKNFLYGSLDIQILFDKLKEQFDHISSRRPVITPERHVDTSLLEILRRYYSKSTNREKVISDLLTDRKKLERLYFELRKSRGFTVRMKGWLPKSEEEEEEEEEDTAESSTAPNSPLVVEPERITSLGTQTRSIPPQSWAVINEEVKKVRAKEAETAEKEAKFMAAGGRRSSVDNDDVSPSVSDTIKRYLRMARKKSVDSDKADRFKRVNYDRNLRNIKGKGEPSISEDDGTDKSAQTDESWIVALRDLKIETTEIDYPSSRSSLTEGTVSPTSPTSKSFLSSGQTFLTNLLHGLQDKSAPVPGGGGTMHKSKSSTSVVPGSRLVSKKIWKSRSKSQSRATPSATSVWTPQGRCVWSNVSGRSVTLTETTLQQLTEIERRILQKVALAKLQALNLGVTVKIPSESPQPSAVVQKPKRKAYLLKRKAITTGFFDSSHKDKGSSTESCSGNGGGTVFGIPLEQCVENERAKTNQLSPEEPLLELRRKSHHGSRGSFSSLIEPRPDERGSCESLICPTLSMPGLDNISCGSANNICSGSDAPRVPYLVSSCLNHLALRGLNTLGIFRVSSSKKRVRQLREDFDCGKEMNLENEMSPHDVATLLKEYFRDLPDPLLCKDLYAAFIQTQRIRNRRLQHEALQHLVQLLPVANRDTLYSLLSFLALVAGNCDDHRNNEGEWIAGNKMDSNNLATLFAPNILHPCTKRPAKEEMSQERMEERSDSINVIRCLIDNYRSLYQVSAELLDEVYVHMMDSHPELLDQIMRKKDISLYEQEDSNVDSNLDEERKYWSRESCTHEMAATGGPDVAMRPRRTSKKRRDEIVIRKRSVPSGSGGESASSSRRASDEKRISSSDSDHLSPQDNHSDGVITASLKIPVPAVTSFSLNLDDIPYIEDNERQQITLGLMKCGGGNTSESGIGSFSPPTRPPSVTSSWGSTSPETEPTLGSLSFPTSRQEALKVTICTTPQVHPGYTRSDVQTGRHIASYSRLLSVDRISKSASSSSMSSNAPIPTSISSIGGAVLRSKTADIERMLRLSGSSSGTSIVSHSDKEYRRRHSQTREESKAESQATSRSESRGGIWKRREIISSEPKERRNLY
ncbi:uncharacterized protein LOC106666238 isoform X2 [Cimex lectularius]|uniref:Rho-GAP domain-containing protein n=1 Tax=Cimex lectularius TaxID=79782 RepID=A0A8I6RVH5_CIMLE|nr:uncharacterized protein LOC106666238 isoform X2 [Cimex lectularius]